MFANVGKILRLLRELRGLSQAEVARHAGIGSSQLSKYERGTELPKLESLERVLRVLDFRQDSFFCAVALLDHLPAALSGEPGAPLALLSIFPTTGSLPSLDEAFESTFRSLLALQRSVLEAVLTFATARSTAATDHGVLG
jgi:transcriptional regulator with XRE-family HTH domain